MSAVLRDSRLLLAMTTAHLDAVLAVELKAYEYPWTRGNFIDSLAAGHPAQVLVDANRDLLGYFVAMAAPEEMHLLNLTVAPAAQGHGHARHMLHELVEQCRRRGARQLWLEVRNSNARARAIYLHYGFDEVGVRKRYYPAAQGRREDAVVMSLQIAASSTEAGDALD